MGQLGDLGLAEAFDHLQLQAPRLAIEARLDGGHERCLAGSTASTLASLAHPAEIGIVELDPTPILHVGTHKTGTTALQHSLKAASPELEACGISYDPNLGGKKTVDTAHHSLARLLGEPETDDTRRVLGGYRKAIAQELDKGRDVVISSERIYRMKVNDGLAADSARRRYLDRVAGFFVGLPVELIVYFRRPDTYIESFFREMATKPKATSFANCIGPRISVSYTQRLQEFQQTFENVSSFCFEDAVAEGLVSTFLRRHALAERCLVDTNVRRQSVSFRGASWLGARKARAREGGRSKREMWLFCLDMSHHPLLKDAKTDRPWTSSEERAAYYRRMVDGFAHADFWSPPEDTVTPVSCQSVDLEAIDALYRDWLKHNRMRLEIRWRHKVPPYAADPEAGRRERIALRAGQWLRSLARR